MLLGFAVYANALGNPFMIDDPSVIARDVRVHEFRIGELLTGNYRQALIRDLLYRPLVKISFALNWTLSHEAWAFRVPNVVLHAAAAFVLFLLTRDLVSVAHGGQAFWAGLVASAVFVVHPIHTEPLNAIVGRADLGAAAFGLLAVWLYWRDGVQPYRRGRVWPALAVLWFGAAILFKESALPLVGVVALLDAWPPRPGKCHRPAGWFSRRVRRCYLPLAIVLVGYFAARTAALGSVAAKADQIHLIDNVIANPEHGLRPGDSRFLARWGTPLATFGKAVGLTIWPQPLCWDYSYAAIETVKRLSDPRLLFGAACLVAILAAMAASFRRRRVIFLALGIGLVAYSIVSNTFVLIGTVFAERLLYLPSAGFCLLVGIVAGAFLQSVAGRREAGAGPRRSTGLLAAVMIVAGTGSYAWRTVDRNRDWQSRDRLHSADLKTNPNSCRLLSAAAANAVADKDFDTAMKYANRAIAIHPDHSNSWKSLGAVYWERGAAKRALPCLKRCLELGGGGDETAITLTATIMVFTGDYPQAIRLLKDFVHKHPLAATARNNLAWYLLRAQPPELRDPEAALRYATQAVELQPDLGGVIDTYVEALLVLNRRDEARDVLQRSLSGIPADDPHRRGLEKKLKDLRNR